MATTAAAVRQHLGVTLHTVQTSPYARLSIEGLAFPYWIASCVVEGDVTTETAGHASRVGPGGVMVHPPRVPFDERAAGPGVHRWFAFEASGGDEDDGSAPDAVPDLLTRHPVPLVVPLGPERAARYAAAFDALEAAWRSPAADPTRGPRCAAWAALLLAEIIDAWRDSGLPPRPEDARSRRHDRFADVVAWMEARLSERITRDDLAARACLHPGSFDRAFRAAHGVPPLRLLQEMRLRRARRLLRDTDETLENIARVCGLGDAARLGRTFRARCGVSPGAWRAAARAESTIIGYIPPLSPAADARYNPPDGNTTDGSDEAI